MQQCAIGGEYGLKSLLPCHGDKLGQERVEQWLAHQMEIEEAYLAPNLVREQVEFLSRQLSPFPLMLGAEVAVEVARIRDFYVTAINHFLFNVANQYAKLRIIFILLRISQFSRPYCWLPP